MNSKQITAILDKIHTVKIAIYGDFCLDAYWVLDPAGGEISVETGLRTQAVSQQYYTPGGAANVAANVAALQPQLIQVIGVIGEDVFGWELARQLQQLSIDTGYFVTQAEQFDTFVYSKRYLNDQEQPRIDFGYLNRRSIATDAQILKHLRAALKKCDVLIFNQQIQNSISPEFIDQANQLFREFNNKIILLDSRHYGSLFTNVSHKTNAVEAARLAGNNTICNDDIPLANIKKVAQQLWDTARKPVFITCGARGIVTADAEGIHQAPGIQFMKRLDTVGAGDTVLSALALSLAGGVKPSAAAEFANLAAGVTVQKMLQTGTASGPEIQRLAQDVYYTYHPEQAENLARAHYLAATDIEICGELPELGLVKHILFDHDGTLSTLREGWHIVMEEMMVKSIMGRTGAAAELVLLNKIRKRVQEYIRLTAGLQTIEQMQGLQEMVIEFGLLPHDKVLTSLEYKKIFMRTLMGPVNQRLVKIKKGQLDAGDFTIKGAIPFLQALATRGISLYLASGTDTEDVVNEATQLGYAKLFNGGIHGSSDDVHKMTKKELLEKIIADNKLSGPELAVFGDGPVEIRECRKRGGIAIGVASDELRRHGLDNEKRTRLIKAGAHIIIPDYSQQELLMRLLLG